MSDKLSLSELLAYRDGQPVAADTPQNIAQDPELAAQLDALVAIKDDLNALPLEEPPPQMWAQIQAAAAERSNSQDQAGPGGSHWYDAPKFRLATAAGVFAVALLGSLLWLPNLGQQSQVAGTNPLNIVPGNNIQQLVGRSQELERAVQSQVSVAGLQPSSSQRALMFRIADLDAELNSLQQESMHPQLKERLWRQRVELLETLMEIQRYQMVEQADF